MDLKDMKEFGFEDLNVRKSVFDMQVVTLDGTLSGRSSAGTGKIPLLFLSRRPCAHGHSEKLSPDCAGIRRSR